MAQSRPPPSRAHTAATSNSTSSPPSHLNHEKRHHSRRKSGKSEHSQSHSHSHSHSHATTVVSEKKTNGIRPLPQSRKSAARPRDREESDDRGRDSGESFPQFCMSCEKQFLPPNNSFLYCSESCRVHDLNPPSGPSRTSTYPGAHINSTPPLTPYGLHFPTSHEDGPDIIPRFSPTQSRPRSYFSSEPYPSSYQAPSALSASVPHNHYNMYAGSGDAKKSSYMSRRTGESSSALESLREIAGALPKVSSSSSSAQKERKGSRDSINNESSSGVWSYIPFTSSSSTANTPGNSYTQPSPYSVSQSQSYGREDVHSYSYGNTGGVTYSAVSYASTGGMGMDRPLPPRSGPGGYGHRPKSIDLVTPFSSGY